MTIGWPKGWTQRDEDEMNVRDELLLLIANSKSEASKHTATPVGVRNEVPKEHA